MNEDSDLREQFRSLRRAEGARSPSFDAVLGRAQRPAASRFGGSAALAAVVIAAMAVVALQVARRPNFRHDGGPAPMLADWRAPTDFLLDTPGQALLHTVPEFGRYPSAVPTAFPPTRTTTPAHRAGATDDIAQNLFAPDLVFKYRQDIELDEAQSKALKDLVQKAQSRFLDLQWDMQAEAGKLPQLLHTPQIDEAAAPTQVDKVLGLEREVKKAQLSLLIRMKNLLTPTQQQKLLDLRSKSP